MNEEMVKLRQMLDDECITWEDASNLDYPMNRTHFRHRGCDWSVIHGYGSYGGYSLFTDDEGLLEMMSDACNDGNPIGWLTAEEVMEYVRGKKGET